MVKIRPQFNKVKFQVWAVYQDDTEELVKEFKYKKVAERFLKAYNVDGGVLEIRETLANVL